MTLRSLAFALLALAATLVHGQSAKSPVLIGLDAEFGHTTSTSDDAIRMGMLTAIDEINAAGGVLNGRPLQLVERDNRSVPVRGRDNFNELAAMRDLVAVFTGKFSSVAIEQAPMAETLKVPLMMPWASADEIVSEVPAGSYAFRLSMRNGWAIPAMMGYLQKRGIARVGVMLSMGAAGRSNEAQVERHTQAGHAPKVVGIQFYSYGTKSLASQYEKLVSAGAQAIFFAGNEVEGALLVREIAALPAAQRLPVVSQWGVTGGDFVELCGDALRAVDFAVVQTFTFNGRQDARATAVVARAEKLFGFKGASRIPSQHGFAQAYDLTHILARAIRLARSTERPDVRAALERVVNYDGLVDRFPAPFTATRHEALAARHVFIGRFAPDGTILRLGR